MLSISNSQRTFFLVMFSVFLIETRRIGPIFGGRSGFFGSAERSCGNLLMGWGKMKKKVQDIQCLPWHYNIYSGSQNVWKFMWIQVNSTYIILYPVGSYSISN